MKLKQKLIAAAVALVAASGANAAIDNGAGGNGELFFNIWDANGSYTRDLNVSIDSFQSQLGAAGNLNLSFAADATFTSFLAGVADTAALKWNIMATDTSGARRLLTTFTAPQPATTQANDMIRTAATNVQAFIGFVNTASAGADSVAVNNGSAAWAGKSAFRDTAGVMTSGTNLLNFSNAGTLANNSYANGLGFMRIDARATGVAASSYNPYMEGTTAVNAWFDASNALHIAALETVPAIPEPSEYALMLAGLGMLGFMARRRLANRA